MSDSGVILAEQRSKMGKREPFENLLVWKKSMDLVAKVYQCCQDGKLSRDWSLRDQIQRSAVSVAANIAEGYERDSQREYVRYSKIAKGSVGELRCLLRISFQLGFLADGTAQGLIDDSTEAARMLRGLITSLGQERP